MKSYWLTIDFCTACNDLRLHPSAALTSCLATGMSVGEMSVWRTADSFLRSSEMAECGEGTWLFLVFLVLSVVESPVSSSGKVAKLDLSDSLFARYMYAS
jgi:hypothetical protein